MHHIIYHISYHIILYHIISVHAPTVNFYLLCCISTSSCKQQCGWLGTWQAMSSGCSAGPTSCHFQDCKALLTTVSYVSSAIASAGLFPFYFTFWHRLQHRGGEQCSSYLPLLWGWSRLSSSCSGRSRRCRQSRRTSPAPLSQAAAASSSALSCSCQATPLCPHETLDTVTYNLQNIASFVEYRGYDSVTDMLSELGLSQSVNDFIQWLRHQVQAVVWRIMMLSDILYI